MPLTIAHPALVIPIRRRLVFSALVIGSVAPDFSKIFSLSRESTLGHSGPGIFWFCVPVGLISFILFQHVLKKSLFLLLPTTHQKRLVPWLNPLALRTAAQWGLVILSIIIGAFTHLLWDSFTHKHGWFVEASPFLQSDLFTFGRHPFPIYECLQHASALAGLFFIAACYARFYRKATIHALPSIPLISSKTKSLLGCSFVVMAAVAATIYANAHPYPMISWSSLAERAAVGFMGSFCVELIVFSVLCMLFFRNSEEQS